MKVRAHILLKGYARGCTGCGQVVETGHNVVPEEPRDPAAQWGVYCEGCCPVCREPLPEGEC